MFGYKKRILCVGILVIVALLFGCCKAQPVAPPNAPEDTVQGLKFNFTRIDALDVDDDRNSAVYLLDTEVSDRLNALLTSETWVAANDIPPMGLGAGYQIYDDAGREISVEPWDENRCLVAVVQYPDGEKQIDCYYAPTQVSVEFHAFMDTLTPLPGVLSGEAERYFDLFDADPGFVVIARPLNEEDAVPGGFSDGQLAAYACIRMENYDNGNTADEYHAITEKYFGRKIVNFDNSLTETIPGTDRVRPTGWDIHRSVYMVLQSEITTDEDGFFVGDFDAYELSESLWMESPALFTNIKEYLLTGNDENYPEPIRVRVVFQTEWETQGAVLHEYPVYKSISVLP